MEQGSGRNDSLRRIDHYSIKGQNTCHATENEGMTHDPSLAFLFTFSTASPRIVKIPDIKTDKKYFFVKTANCQILINKL